MSDEIVSDEDRDKEPKPKICIWVQIGSDQDSQAIGEEFEGVEGSARVEAGAPPPRVQAAILALTKRQFGAGIAGTDATWAYLWGQVRSWLEESGVWDATPTFEGIVRVPPSASGGES